MFADVVVVVEVQKERKKVNAKKRVEGVKLEHQTDWLSLSLSLSLAVAQ